MKFYNLDKDNVVDITISDPASKNDDTLTYMGGKETLIIDGAYFDDDSDMWCLSDNTVKWWKTQEKKWNVLAEVLEENDMSFQEFADWVEDAGQSFSDDLETFFNECVEYAKVYKKFSK